MSGYREHSYDPYAYERQGAPVRPYNWVQWTGVGLGVLGAAICVYFLLGRAGLVPPIDSPMPGAILPLLGVSLINSRRHPAHDPAPELAQARKRWMIIVVALCAAILGAAVAIQFSQGA